MENQIDKSKELRGSITLVNNRLQFKGEVTGNSPVMIDYVPPLGDNLGYTSLELLLLSLSSCVGSAFLVVCVRCRKQLPISILQRWEFAGRSILPDLSPLPLK